jgi:hypothetical protein
MVPMMPSVPRQSERMSGAIQLALCMCTHDSATTWFHLEGDFRGYTPSGLAIIIVVGHFLDYNMSMCRICKEGARKSGLFDVSVLYLLHVRRLRPIPLK